MISSISLKTPDFLNILKAKRTAIDPKIKEAISKLPANSVPRSHPSAAGILPLWDLFQDDNSGLGIAILKDGSYRCCYELDGIHVSGFDEVRLITLMNHFTGLINSIDTSVQLTVVCHNISKEEYFASHPVDAVNDEFLKYVAKCVEEDQEFLLSRNFVPELKFFITFCYRPPKEKPAHESWIKNQINHVVDVFSNQTVRQTVSSHSKNINTLIQRAIGYIGQIGNCGMSGRPISADEYFQMLYRELNPSQANDQNNLPLPVRPRKASVPANLRRVFPDMEPATIREQITESCYDFSHADYIKISDFTDAESEQLSTIKQHAQKRILARDVTCAPYI